MAKLRKPLPFPFAFAREKRAHQLRTELQPSIRGSKTSHFDDELGHSRRRVRVGFERHSEAEVDGDSGANEAFFGNGGEGRITKPDGLEGPEKPEKKTPAMRLKKRAKGLDLDVLDGLVTQPIRSRMRICSLNAKAQTSPDTNDGSPPQTILAVDLRLGLPLTTVYVAFLFMLYPHATLDLTLVVLMFFAPFPEWMPWWTALLAMVLPMGLRARFEVTVFLCVVLWVGGWEWGDAWRRVGRWVWDV